jgi:hypothetical protein
MYSGRIYFAQLSGVSFHHGREDMPVQSNNHHGSQEEESKRERLRQ